MSVSWPGTSYEQVTLPHPDAVRNEDQFESATPKGEKMPLLPVPGVTLKLLSHQGTGADSPGEMRWLQPLSQICESHSGGEVGS